jgi:hypothetical protein
MFLTVIRRPLYLICSFLEPDINQDTFIVQDPFKAILVSVHLP